MFVTSFTGPQTSFGNSLVPVDDKRNSISSLAIATHCSNRTPGEPNLSRGDLTRKQRP